MASPSSSSSISLNMNVATVVLLGLLSVSLPVLAQAVVPKKVIDAPLLTQKIAANRTIKVDIAGNGDFKSIQAAIDSVPAGNPQWIIVHVRKGIYRERVLVPENKPHIFLRGNGKGRTWIVSEQSSPDNLDSATFRVEAKNFVAFGISFKNDAFITDVRGAKINQTVAVAVSADKAAFYHCGFYSAYNTLFDNKGRHYYEDCYIQGSVDFIFGRGQSIFQSCDIFVNADLRMKIHGSITAQKREHAQDNSGFVFVGGSVYGIGGVFLGRAKGAFSRVVFAHTYISRTIVPDGWTNWSYDGPTDNLYHAEYQCSGPGAAVGERVKWAKQLSKAEAEPLLSINFISGTEWLPAWL